MEGRHGDPHDGAHAPEQRPVVVGQDLQVPRMSTAGGATSGREAELFSAPSCPGVDGSLLNLNQETLSTLKQELHRLGIEDVYISLAELDLREKSQKTDLIFNILR